MDASGWKTHLEHHRHEKDRFFEEHPRSPIPEDERDTFEGLAYYEPDPAYRFVVELDTTDAGQTVEVQRTAGDTVTYEKAGTFHLGLPEGEVTLAAYRTPNHDEDELFLPFQDGTSGEETYGAGRYLDATRMEDGWLVDLNQAYHPFCAYDEAYTCPLPPFENRVEVPIRAGERSPEDSA